LNTSIKLETTLFPFKTLKCFAWSLILIDVVWGKIPEGNI